MGLFNRDFKNKELNLFAQISELLLGKGIKFRRDGDNGRLYKFEANVDDRVIGCMLVCDINRSLLTFSSILPYQIPNDKLLEFLEMIARFNEKIWYGSFEFSFEFNIISLVTTLPIDNASISYEQLERLCFNNLLNVHYFQSGFEKLLHTNSKLEDVYTDIITNYQNNRN